MADQWQTKRRYEKAVIPDDKIEKYALNPEHPVGKHKARVFKSALGFEQADWKLLVQCIMDELPYHGATLVEEGKWGKAYDVVLPVTGPSGATIEVLTAWIVRPGTDHPSLTTTLVQKRKK